MLINQYVDRMAVTFLYREATKFGLDKYELAAWYGFTRGWLREKDLGRFDYIDGVETFHAEVETFEEYTHLVWDAVLALMEESGFMSPEVYARVQLQRDKTGRWVHVMNDVASPECLSSLLDVKGEICVSDIGETNLFQLRERLIAAVFDGCCSYVFDHDVWSTVDWDTGLREATRVGSCRTEGWLVPATARLVGFVIEDDGVREFFQEELDGPIFASLEDVYWTSRE